MLMESKSQLEQGHERPQMVRRWETPYAMALDLMESAEKVGQSKPEELIDNLLDFKQNIFNFMRHFYVIYEEFKPLMDKKRKERGGFSKGAVQKHAFKGLDGSRLVRDRLSDQFLDLSDKEPYFSLLNRKLEEETRELVETQNRKERREELGDVFEVFNTILHVRGMDEGLIERIRQGKTSVEFKKRRRELEEKK